MEKAFKLDNKSYEYLSTLANVLALENDSEDGYARLEFNKEEREIISSALTCLLKSTPRKAIWTFRYEKFKACNKMKEYSVFALKSLKSIDGKSCEVYEDVKTKQVKFDGCFVYVKKAYCDVRYV